jgi:hypothetical protein
LLDAAWRVLLVLLLLLLLLAAAMVVVAVLLLDVSATVSVAGCRDCQCASSDTT